MNTAMLSPPAGFAQEARNTSAAKVAAAKVAAAKVAVARIAVAKAAAIEVIFDNMMIVYSINDEL
jgi:hypothetical protein